MDMHWCQIPLMLRELDVALESLFAALLESKDTENPKNLLHNQEHYDTFFPFTPAHFHAPSSKK